MSEPRVAVVFGARTLGRAIASHFADAGWHVVAASRTQETIALLGKARPGIDGQVADVGEPGAAARVLDHALERSGRLDLVVNAIADPDVIASALKREAQNTEDLQSGIGKAVTPVHNVVEATLARLRAQADGTFVQITGGLALRARRGTGALAATAYATRALIEGCIAEAREDGVHVALLVIRGLIEGGYTTDMLRGAPPRASMAAADVNAALEFLLTQSSARAWTHEMTLTPPEAKWED